MYGVSRRFLAALAGAPRWLPLVEWSPDGLSWNRTNLHAGTVKQDSTSQVRWSLEGLELSGVPVGRDGLNPFGPLLRAKVGMVHGPDDVEWVPLGVYRCGKVKRSLVGPTVSVSALSFEQAVIDADYPAPRILPGGISSQVIASLVREVIPSATVTWRLSADPVQSRITTGTSRWAVIDGSTTDPSIARALGAQVFTDRSGAFVVDLVPSLYDDPVWTVEEGPGGVLITAAEELSRAGLYNVVAVTGQSEDPNVPPVGPAIASDDDPTSPTYAGADPGRGGFGQSVLHYSSPLVRTMDGARQAALSLLAPRLGLQQQIEWTAAPNPALDAGDVVLARNPSGLTPTILDQLDLDLATMAQTGRCRATTTRLAGDVGELAPSQDS